MTDLRFSSTTACTIDIAMGFDISTRRVSGESLVSGHNKLQAFLPEIARYLSTVPRLCCTNSPVQSNLAYRVVNVDGRVLYDFNFEAHDEDVLRKVMALSLSESTSFNRAMLGSFREKFEAQSQAGVKVRRCCGMVLLNRLSYEQRLQAFSLFVNFSQVSLTFTDGSNDELYKL